MSAKVALIKLRYYGLLGSCYPPVTYLFSFARDLLFCPVASACAAGGWWTQSTFDHS